MDEPPGMLDNTIPTIPISIQSSRHDVGYGSDFSVEKMGKFLELGIRLLAGEEEEVTMGWGVLGSFT